MAKPYDLNSPRMRAVIVGAIGGITFFVYYALGQRPPNYITPLNPVGVLLFFLAIGAMGACATGEWRKATRAARYGALAGAVTGALSSITLIILHNYAKYIHGLSIDFSALFRDLTEYIILGPMATAMIAIATMVLGAVGGIALSLVMQFFDTIIHFGRYRR